MSTVNQQNQEPQQNTTMGNVTAAVADFAKITNFPLTNIIGKLSIIDHFTIDNEYDICYTVCKTILFLFIFYMICKNLKETKKYTLVSSTSSA